MFLRISTHRRQRRSAAEAQKLQDLPLIEDFDPPEATTVGVRGLKNPRPSIFKDFDPLEASTPLKRGFKNPRPSFFEDFDPPEATTIRHRGVKIQAFNLQCC